MNNNTNELNMKELEQVNGGSFFDTFNSMIKEAIEEIKRRKELFIPRA